MAIISVLRTKMTKWVVGAVFVAMALFIVGGDLFGSGPRSIFSGDDRNIGEIAGTDISYEEYNVELMNREQGYMLNFGRNPGERERSTLQAQAWEVLIAKNAIQPQYDKVGLKVTTDEVWDMVQGKNIDDGIRQAFVDSSGRFDRNALIKYLQRLNEMPATSMDRVRWETFKNDLKPGRERVKYENLIIKSAYVTEAEAEQDYHSQNDVAEIKYLYVPYFAVSDSAVKVTDSDLKDYYEKNKKRYKTENTRSFSYVVFPVAASAADSLALRTEMAKITEGFKTSTEDSVYALSNSDGSNFIKKYIPNELPPRLSNMILSTGQVIGPVLEDGSLKIYKVSKIGHDSTYSAKASHILIRWDNDTKEAKEAAKEKARKILKDIKGGASFSDKAAEFGTDGTKTRGGDLGWFKSGGMVKPFEEAVFKAKKVGLLDDVVETEFGYHIIEVTATKDNIYYSIAEIERPISPSEETLDVIHHKVQTFSADLSGVDAFKAKAKSENLSVLDANDVVSTERRINNLGEVRTTISWLFREGEVGKVSTFEDNPDNYIVAVMTGETKKGFKSFEKVKEEIRPQVTRQLQNKYIAEKLKGKTESLEDLSRLFGKDASVNTLSDLKLNTTTMPAVGFDPTVIGTMFSLENGKRSAPIIAENGVVVADVQTKTIAPAMEMGYGIYKSELQKTSNNKSYNVVDALKELAKIEDKRYKFF